MRQPIPFMPRAIALAVVGGLSAPSKMPCPGFSLPAIDACPTGAKLALTAGTTCSRCYADDRGNYRFPNVKAALVRNLTNLLYWQAHDPDHWVQAMASLLYFEPWFRWFISGDVINATLWDMILKVVRLTPHTEHWLPTREVWVSNQYAALQDAYPNLVVRLSAPLVDGEPPQHAYTSTVHSRTATKTYGHTCAAPTQDNKCGACRACWSKDVKNVSYKQH